MTGPQFTGLQNVNDMSSRNSPIAILTIVDTMLQVHPVLYQYILIIKKKENFNTALTESNKIQIQLYIVLETES